MNILSFGEIIIDIENGTKTVGGAPLNFAIHMARMGHESYIYSAVGNDNNGLSAKEFLRNENINEKYLLSSEKKTATCILKNKGYEISQDSSFDSIPYVPLQDSFHLLYLGTLALRSEDTRTTLEKLLKYSFAEIFFDINIRQNFYSPQLIEQLLSIATIYKASRDDIFNLYGKDTDLENYCFDIAKSHPQIKIILISLDSDGAMLYHTLTGKFIYQSPFPCHFVSSVGAGDSFSAAFMNNYFKGNSLEICLERGCMMGAFVASMPGAVPQYTNDIIEKTGGANEY